MASARGFSSDHKEFQKILDSAKNIVVITGQEILKDSGYPIFKDQDDHFRRHDIGKLAHPILFKENASVAWELYHFRREVAFSTHPMKTHRALAVYQNRCKWEGRKLSIITQNTEGLHILAGSKNVIELFGSLEKVMCLNPECKAVRVNKTRPICEALRNRGNPSLGASDFPIIAIEDLPKCSVCSYLVRPFVSWPGEALDPELLKESHDLIDACDLCIVVGTSASEFPAALFTSKVIQAGKPIATFNTSPQPYDPNIDFHFRGICGESLETAFGLTLFEDEFYDIY